MRLPIAVATLALLGACAHRNVLLPAPGANLSPGGGAAGEAAGVHIDVKGDAWEGDPRNLGEFLTPVLVEITNGSERSIQVRYSNFGLVGQSGFRYAALPPFQPMGTAYGDRGVQDEDVAPAAARPPPPARHAAHRPNTSATSRPGPIPSPSTPSTGGSITTRGWSHYQRRR